MATEKEIEAATNAIAKCMSDDCDMRSGDPIRAYAEAALRAAAPTSPALGEEELARALCQEITDIVNAGSRAAYREGKQFVLDAEKLHITFARAILSRASTDKVRELEAEVAEWRQAAEVEAGLRREFLARAEKAEASLAEARKVIEPFAAMADWYNRNTIIDALTKQRLSYKDGHAAIATPDLSLSVGNLRAARDWLSAQPGNHQSSTSARDAALEEAAKILESYADEWERACVTMQPQRNAIAACLREAANRVWGVKGGGGDADKANAVVLPWSDYLALLDAIENPKPNPELAKLLRSKAPWEPPTSGASS